MSGALANRLDRIERRLGLHRVTVTRPCPRCEATGSVEFPADLGVLRHTALWLGQPEPEPGEQRPCRLCRGRGQVAVEVADQYAADAERATEFVVAKLTVMAERHTNTPPLPVSPRNVSGSAPDSPGERLDSPAGHPDSPPPDDDA